MFQPADLAKVHLRCLPGYLKCSLPLSAAALAFRLEACFRISAHIPSLTKTCSFNGWENDDEDEDEDEEDDEADEEDEVEGKGVSAKDPIIKEDLLIHRFCKHLVWYTASIAQHPAIRACSHAHIYEHVQTHVHADALAHAHTPAPCG